MNYTYNFAVSNFKTLFVVFLRQSTIVNGFTDACTTSIKCFVFAKRDFFKVAMLVIEMTGKYRI